MKWCNTVKNEKHVTKRLVWARENIDQDFSNVIFTDECSIWAHMGFGILYLFTCNLNAEKMLEIYKKALLPSAERWFIDKNEDWILQEDNDPKHRSKLCTE